MDGDENSKFFHWVVKGRLKQNSLKGLNINGVWLEDPNTLKEKVWQFFKDPFTEKVKDRLAFVSTKFRKLDEAQGCFLDGLITDEEIKDVVWSCQGSKAPGMDGYTFTFSRSIGRC